MSNGILLVEIYIEDLPFNDLNKIGKNFINYLSNELNNNYFFYEKKEYFITPRRISSLIYNINYYQNFKKNKNFKIINKNKNNINFFINKILNKIILKLIKNFRSIIWNSNNYIFLRPINNIIVMFNDIVLDVEIFNIKSNNILFGNRFIKKNNIILKNSNDYIYYLLKYGKVIIRYKDRKKKILNLLNKISLKNNFILNYKISFLNKIISIIEWPNIILCKFNKKFLFLPNDFIIYILKKKYCFCVFDLNNKILNYFIVIIDIKVSNYKYIINCYENIINSNLNDMYYLFLKDRKYNLISNFSNLKNIIFHKKLGNYLDKIRRILYLCKYIFKNNNNLILDLNILYHIVILFKCDLSTNLCLKYMDLKGIIGMNYSLLDGELKYISLILKEQYFFYKNNYFFFNNFYSLYIILIDKIDTFIGISIINNFIFLKKSNDPYGIKKICFSIIKLIINNNIYINLYNILKFSISLFSLNYIKNIILILNFIKNRFINLLLNLGYNKKIVYSITIKINNFDLFDIKNRIDVINNIKNKYYFNKLLNVNKRINNIILKFNNFIVNKKINKIYILLKEEIILYKYIILLKKLSKKCYINHNYIKLIKYFFVSIKKIEKFFKFIKINIKNKKIKENRLILLKKLNNLFLNFFNFSFYY